MGPILNEREAQYVGTVLKRDRMRMQLGWIFMMLLVLGGVVFVVTAILTLPKMNDETALRVTLPGFAIGLLLIVISILGVSWVKQQHLIASILRKLQRQSLKDENNI
jgi:hypothetical protein